MNLWITSDKDICLFQHGCFCQVELMGDFKWSSNHLTAVSKALWTWPKGFNLSIIRYIYTCCSFFFSIHAFWLSRQKHPKINTQFGIFLYIYIHHFYSYPLTNIAFFPYRCNILFCHQDPGADASAATQCPVAMLPFKIPSKAFQVIFFGEASQPVEGFEVQPKRRKPILKVSIYIYIFGIPPKALYIMFMSILVGDCYLVLGVDPGTFWIFQV